MTRLPDRFGRLALLLGSLLAFGLPGCATSARTARPAPRTQSPPSAVAKKPGPRPVPRFDLDSVTNSSLRERAIDVLQSHAASEDPRLRANALEALARVPQRLSPLAVAALKDPSPAVRAVAAMSIGRAKLKGLAGSVRLLLNDSSDYVRAAAVMGLAKLGDSPDPTPVAGMLLGSPSVKLRSHAAFVIGELGNSSAVGLLRDAARQPIPRGQEAEWRLFQLQIAEARAKLGDTGQLEIIRAALYPGSPEGLEAAVLATQILGQVQDKYSRDSLLWMIEGTKETGPSTAPAELRLTAGHALAKMGLVKGAADLAREYAKDPSPVIRAQVAAVFADAGAASDLPGLERWMMSKASSGAVAVAAADAIVSITDRDGAGR
jgi:HEAT repeat protein